MQIKILMAALSFMSCSVFAEITTLAHDVHENSEVTVQSIGDSACLLSYKNSDYLTSEGKSVFYTFQVELGKGRLQHGMQSWLPYGITAGEPTTLSFHDKRIGKIYEYTDNISQYGELFYQTDLFPHFLTVDNIFIRQGNVTTNMPVYRKADISESTQKSFQNCINNLNKVLSTFCKSSSDASKLCEAKKIESQKPYMNEVIKDDPKFIAVAKALEKANAIAAVKARAADKALSEMKATEAAKATAKAKAFEAAVALEVAKAVTAAKKAGIAERAARAAEIKNRKKLAIFDDKAQAPYQFKTFDRIITKTANSGMRGKVMRVNYSTDKGVAYYASDKAIDYSEYDYIEFDLKLIADPSHDSGLNIRMDCLGFCSSGIYKIEKPRLGEWKHYKVSFKDLINNPGSNLDITSVNVPFAILPDRGFQKGVALLIDSIYLTNY